MNESMESRRHYVILLAGGHGTRMGGEVAKQFLELRGKPVLLRTIELFRSSEWNPELIVVLPPEYKEYWKRYCMEHALWFRHTIVSGGITRFHSVRNALKFVPDDAVVAVHDGVRPFVPKEMLERLLKFDFNDPENKKQNIAGVIPVMPAVESMREKIPAEKSGDGRGFVEKTVPANRERFLFVQTPQVFDAALLKQAYERPYSPAFTDDASVAEQCGYAVAMCEGSRFNIKITVPEDLKMAELILSIFSS